MRATMKKVLMTVLAVFAVVTISFAQIQKERSVSIIELLESNDLEALAAAYTACEMY
jgi:uncharacterized protein YxeA